MVEVKQVDLAEQMIRALARQAEAERERRAKKLASITRAWRWDIQQRLTRPRLWRMRSRPSL